MSLPLRQYKASTIKTKRTKPRRIKAVRCRPHINWVLDNFQCVLAGKHNRKTGMSHACEGPLDPHHTPTRGAGGGDDNVVPICRLAHGMLDSPGWSEKRPRGRAQRRSEGDRALFVGTQPTRQAIPAAGTKPPKRRHLPSLSYYIGGIEQMTPIDLDKIKEAAEKATPQNLGTAECVDDEEMDCPLCGGNGFVDSKHYTNYDDAPIGVSFFGVGDEHVKAEAYFRALPPKTILSLVAVVEAARAYVALYHDPKAAGLSEVVAALHPFSHINGEQP